MKKELATLSLAPKRGTIKKGTDVSDQSLEDLHTKDQQPPQPPAAQQQPQTKKPAAPKVKPIRTTLDLDPGLHKRIKQRMLDLDCATLKDYVVALIEKDMESAKV
jgi:hypothetical protein